MDGRSAFKNDFAFADLKPDVEGVRLPLLTLDFHGTADLFHKIRELRRYGPNSMPADASSLPEHPLRALSVLLLGIDTQVENCLLGGGGVELAVVRQPRKGRCRDGFGIVLKVAAEVLAVIAASVAVGAETG